MKSAHLDAHGKPLPSLNPRGATKLSHSAAWSLPIELRKRVKGEVRFDDGSRALYATFEATKIRISKAVGERVLLPAVRTASKDTLIFADAFSCREQIEQLTNRHALHSAQALKMACEYGPRGPSGNFTKATIWKINPWR